MCLLVSLVSPSPGVFAPGSWTQVALGLGAAPDGGESGDLLLELEEEEEEEESASSPRSKDVGGPR